MSAIAAAVGLVVSGVATWTAVEALKDQRGLMAEDDRDKERARAARFTAWRNGWDDRHVKIFVMNRSPDPVISWALVVGNYEDLYDTGTGGSSAEPTELPGDELIGFRITPIGTPLDPCTRYLVDLKDYEDAESVIAVDFVSASGERWRRDLFGGTPERYSGQGIWSPDVLSQGWLAGAEAKVGVSRLGKAELCDAE